MTAFSLRAAARERGSAPALVTSSSSISFDEAWRLARAVAYELRTCSRVAVIATLRLETLLAIYALAELGIPMVLLHPRLTAAERASLVAAAEADRVLDETWTPRADVPADWEPPPAPSDADERPLATLFTSGSTGMPKGVELSRRAFDASARASAENLGWTATDRWLLCMPLGHVGGLSVVLRCLAARVPIVLSPWTGALPPLLEDIERQGATLLSLVPTMLARIFEDLPDYRFPAHVRAVLLGGDASTPSLLATAHARGVPILTTYGMTEACSQIATLTPGQPATPETGVGRPLPGTEVRIAGGEVQVRGGTLFTRYIPVERFPSPFLEGGWFPTGDLGRLDEQGRLHLVGRRSDLIITGGETVDPREVEIALEACSGVRAAAVFPIADERWGQIVAAAVVLHEGSTASPASIAEEIKTRLARHKWPRRIAVCAELAYNATGKLDRRQTARTATPLVVPV